MERFLAAVPMHERAPERMDGCQQAGSGCQHQHAVSDCPSFNMIKTIRPLDDVGCSSIGALATERQDPLVMNATSRCLALTETDDDDDVDCNNNHEEDYVGEGLKEEVDNNNNRSVSSMDCDRKTCWGGSSSSVSSN